MTYSRSGWISLMLAAFVYIWLRNKKLIPLFIALALLAIPLLPSTIITRLTSIVTSFLGGSGHIDSSAQHRFALWQGVEYMIRDYGVSGIGLGPAAFASLYPLYAQPLAIDGAAHTQSLYLELILETGILGFVSFMWLALRSIKNSYRAQRLKHAYKDRAHCLRRLVYRHCVFLHRGIHLDLSEGSVRVFHPAGCLLRRDKYGREGKAHNIIKTKKPDRNTCRA